MSAQIFNTQSKPREPILNLRVATFGSDGGIFRIPLMNGMIGSLRSLIDRKRRAMPKAINSVCHKSGFGVSLSNIMN